MSEKRTPDPKADHSLTPSDLIRAGDRGYPDRLYQLSDPPQQLHVRGRIPDRVMVAIVGTRGADVTARRFTAKLAADLCEHGIAVVSGGARGIDTAAHQGALDAGGRTVAVIGSGFDFLYPRDNHGLFSRIVRTGALVTELPPEQPPTRWTFPRRNRLVAALASAVVVVQAGAHSGALITARLAKGLDVPVGTVPGAPDDARNRGSNRLLKEGAALVEELDDVLRLVEKAGIKRQLCLPVAQTQGINPAVLARKDLTETELKIFDLLGSQPLHIDDISSETGLNASETSAALMALEIAGVVADQGGKNYVKVG